MLKMCAWQKLEHFRWRSLFIPCKTIFDGRRRTKGRWINALNNRSRKWCLFEFLFLSSFGFVYEMCALRQSECCRLCGQHVGKRLLGHPVESARAIFLPAIIYILELAIPRSIRRSTESHPRNLMRRKWIARRAFECNYSRTRVWIHPHMRWCECLQNVFSFTVNMHWERNSAAVKPMARAKRNTLALDVVCYSESCSE